MPGRSFTSQTSYRYGFNGQEKSLEVSENSTTAEFWQYDARIGRRWNVDPVEKEWESPYLCFSGNPIALSDINGDNAGDSDKPKGSGTEKDPYKGADVVVKAARPREAKKMVTYEVKHDFLGVYKTDVTYYFHRGGWKKGDGTFTASGYYEENEYKNLMGVTGVSMALYNATSSLIKPSPYAYDPNQIENSEQNLESLLLGIPSDELLSGLYQNAANNNYKVLFNRTGAINFSSINVEDLIGLGEIAKFSLKFLGTRGANKLAKAEIVSVRNLFRVRKTQNVATLGGIIEGKHGHFGMAVSGEAIITGLVNTPKIRVFSTQIVRYDRLYDSEVKLLEAFAQRFHKTPNIKGKLTLISERTFCPSCESVIEQFQKMFPNVKVNLINGVK